MKKIILAVVAVLALVGHAHASSGGRSWICGYRVTANVGIYKHKTHIDIWGLDKDITVYPLDGVVKMRIDDGGYHFKVRTKWHKKAVNFRYWMMDDWNTEKVTFGGHPCHCDPNGNACLTVSSTGIKVERDDIMSGPLMRALRF